MTNYEVVSFWTTTNEFGGVITTSSTRTYSAPPLTVTATTGEDYVESDWISFFITVDEKGEIVTSSTLFNATRDYIDANAPHTSFGPAPPVETHTVVLENNMTNYEVVSFWTTTNEFGGVITTSSTRTYSAPPLTVTATTGEDYVESDWISFFITVDEKGEIVTSSTLFNATRDYKLPEAPHTSFGPAPPVETHTVVLENNMTNYEVVSFWTTTNEFGGLITTSSTSTYSAPPLTVTATTASDYVESDWISFFITVDEKGDIVTSSTLFNATRDYKLPEAPHTSFGPAPPVETHTVVLENNMTNYEVVSYWTTTNEFGGLITTSSTSTYSAPPLTVTATTEIVTSSTLFNATRDYKLPEAPHTSFGPAPPVETHTVVLENNMTNYEVVSFWTTTNEFGGVITTSSTRTYSAPPLTVTATTGEDYVESDWISFFITVDEKGEIVTSSTLFNATRDYKLPEAPHTSFGPAPPVETHTVVLENNMTNYEVVSFWTTTNEFGGVITTSSTRTYSAPPLTVTATTGEDYVESDWISFFITVDEKGEIVTSSTLFNATRDYKLPEAPHTSFGPAPPVETHTVVLENNMTNYEVVSFWTTTNEFGGVITTSSTRTYSAPPLTVTATTGEDYVESDWISFFITVDEKGEIVTSSTLFNATRDYKLPEAPHTSFGPAPPVETHTVVLENNMTNYEVVSFWTTTNEFGGVITTSSTRTYSAPPLTVTATTGEDYVESDWISFFITVDEKGEIVTSSTLFNATRDYIDADAPHTSFGPAPPVETHTVVLENNMTNYEVVSFWTTTNEFGGVITTSSTRTYSAPPLTVTATTGEDYVESDWISFFITVDEKGEIVTSSTLFNATRDYIDAEAQHPTFGTPPLPVTSTIEVTEGVTEYVVVSYYTTTNEYGGVITTSTTTTHSPPTVSTIAIETDGSHGTEYISYFITTDSDGKISTGETRLNQGHQSSSKGKSSDLASQTKEGISEKPEAVWTDISQSREHSLPTSVKSNEVGNEVGSGTISEETTQSTSRNTGSHNSEYQISSSHSEVHGHASGSAIKNSKDNEGISPSTVNGGSVPVSSNTNTHREGSAADVSSNNKPNYSSVPTNTIQSRSRTRVTLSSTDTRASGGSNSTSASNLISELSDSHDLTGSASSITFLGIKKCIILLIIVVVSIA
ncbi:hypothetical protein J7294_02962 [Nakaseomyces glabratus]|nr:hypothetical protein J7294_02962 [Nakaseomyces glabratus]